MAIISTDDLAYLRGPHVARCWFLELALPDRTVRYHNGVGKITLSALEWTGVTDPVGGQFVAVDAVEDPRFGQAPAVTITLVSPSLTFFQEMKDIARDLEGRVANLFWGAFDPETEQLDIGLRKLFPGRVSAPRLRRTSSGLRAVTVTIESIWQAQNYPSGGRWSPTGLQQRNAGDRGGEFIGVKVQENWA